MNCTDQRQKLILCSQARYFHSPAVFLCIWVDLGGNLPSSNFSNQASAVVSHWSCTDHTRDSVYGTFKIFPFFFCFRSYRLPEDPAHPSVFFFHRACQPLELQLSLTGIILSSHTKYFPWYNSYFLKYFDLWVNFSRSLLLYIRRLRFV